MWKVLIQTRILLMCAVKYTLISIFGKKFLENWKSNDNFFNSRKNISKNRKLNVCHYKTLHRQQKNKNNQSVKVLKTLIRIKNNHFAATWKTFWFLKSTHIFYILNIFIHISTHFFIHTYIKNIQNTLLKLSYQTGPVHKKHDLFSFGRIAL